MSEFFKIATATLLLAFAALLGGCASFFGETTEKTGPKIENVQNDNLTKFSDNPNYAPSSQRLYKRTTRAKFEEEAELDSKAGSMWVQEGQGSYLFAQNRTRREGDILNVRLEAPAMKQVETKVKVIKMLLQQLEDQEREAELQKKLAAEAAANANKKPSNNPDDKSQAKAEPPKTPERAPAAEKPKDEKEDLSEVQQIQTRITEKTNDGNYRVKGSQPFMIGKREYKVLVMGMIRPEDYNDEGVVSGKLIDAQYDVVSVRRKETNNAPTTN